MASPDPIPIACAADDAYAMPLAVTIRSLLANLEIDRAVRLFVLDGGLRPRSRRRLLASWPRERLQVEWIRPRRNALAGVKTSGHIPLASYFRLLLPELLPGSIERLVYLDADLVVLESVANLWTIDLRGHAIGAVQDLNAPYVSRPNGLRTWRELGFPADRPYFNAGVLLLDLAKWRREAIGQKILDYVERNKDRIRWHDQDGLNAVAGHDCLALDHRWNVAMQGESLPDPRSLAISKDEARALIERPFICHFASHVKPWHTDCAHPRKDLFFRYLKETAWAAFRPRRRSTDPGLRGRLAKLGRYARERGVSWTALHVLRASARGAQRTVERSMMAIEKRDFLVGADTVSSESHTGADNRRWWDAYDWSERGEEWTGAVLGLRGLDPDEWKRSILEGLLLRKVERGARVLEIGPGAGRWTKHLQPIAARLVLVDVSERCLELCRARFGRCENVEFHRVDRPALDFLGDASIDAVWSYDAFVHINPNDTDGYLAEISRVLRPGGIAVIHHAGNYPSGDGARRALRSHVDRTFFAHLVRGRGMELLEQDDRSPHMPGDVVSIFRRPGPAR